MRCFNLKLIILGVLVIILGCSKPRITGKVIDEAMEPLSDATISIINSDFSSKTNNNGEFALDFAPGKITLTASKESYTSDTLNLEISQHIKYPLQNIRLYRILESGNFVLLTDSGYVQLERIEIKKHQLSSNPILGGGVYKYFLSRPINDLTIKSGTNIFLDFDPENNNIALLKDSKYLGNVEFGFMNSIMSNNIKLLKDKYNIIHKDVFLREINLESGYYSWIVIKGGTMGGSYPGEYGYCFKVE